ncbi:hypothetical protein BB559_001440 [Furculomyces boomerangus]|uniref:Zinc/iron permease n=1 Tax=Furculomyces boomerangus TaxID=61424 RepID=A0A2T9Z1X0_9FUNG|nr:hypothetical protein BB559_001440 [Furculomyces boomerangus]
MNFSEEISDTEIWKLVIASALATGLGASVLYIDQFLHFLGFSRRFSLLNSKPFLASSFSCAGAIMMYTSLIVLLSESTHHLLSVNNPQFVSKYAQLLTIVSIILGAYSNDLLSKILVYIIPAKSNSGMHLCSTGHSHVLPEQHDIEALEDREAQIHVQASTKSKNIDRNIPSEDLLQPKSNDNSGTITSGTLPSLASISNTNILEIIDGESTSDIHCNDETCALILNQSEVNKCPKCGSLDAINPIVFDSLILSTDFSESQETSGSNTHNGCPVCGCTSRSPSVSSNTSLPKTNILSTETQLPKNYDENTKKNISLDENIGENSTLLPMGDSSQKIYNSTGQSDTKTHNFHGDDNKNIHNHTVEIIENRNGDHKHNSVDTKDRKIDPEMHDYMDSMLFMNGIKTAAAIAIHKFPEGLIMFMSGKSSLKLGVWVSISLFIHNFPEGMMLALPLYLSTRSKLKTLLLSLVMGVLPPIFGALLGSILVKTLPKLIDPTNIVNNEFNDVWNLTFGLTFGITAGMMLIVSTTGMLPTARVYDPSGKIVLYSFVVTVMLCAFGGFVF